jgi:outer membrane protein assembly factor BamB
MVRGNASSNFRRTNADNYGEVMSGGKDVPQQRRLAAMTRRSIFTCLWSGVLALALLAPALAYAEHTHFWRQSDYADFEKGTAKGVAIRSDGKLVPAPQFAVFSDPNLMYLWALRTDSRGRVYAAGGSDAKVLRFDDPAKPTTVFEAPELSAQTIAFDAHDNLYVGTSPDGKVYKVTPDGQKSVFFDPKAKYIWALALDAQGTLFIGTGDKGEIYAVAPDSTGQLFYQSDERHARSLAFDAKGNLLVGTDPDGLILRIEISRATGAKDSQAPPKAGAAYVVYETDKKEVTSLLADSSGNLYAAAIGEKQRPAGPGPAQPLTTPQPSGAAPPLSAQSAVNLALQAAAAAQPPPAFSLFPSTTGGSQVVKISPAGSPETLWTSREDLVFSMGFSPNGKVLLGTGNKGAIIELQGDGVYSIVAKTVSSQVTSLTAGRDGQLLVGTANPGKIFTLGPGQEADGSFESDPFDAKIFSHWGRLTWWGENGPTQGKASFYVRSGNTSNPEKEWSPWSGPYNSTSGEAITCPPARFLQWKAVFQLADKRAAPEVSWVSIAYQPENVAPVVDDIAIQDPGVRVQGFTASPGGPATPAAVQLKTPQRSSVGATAFPNISVILDTASKSQKMDVPPQGFEEKSYQSVLWSAHDDNDDDLIFAVYYRAEGEQTWRLLKDKLAQHFYSWDTTTMPDGAYYLKIVASDLPSNPPGQALSNERISDRFEIQNTPPRIENLRADTGGPAAKITFDGVSSGLAITRAQYSVDAGEWFIVFPTSGLSDGPKENYQIELPRLAPGPHTIAVQVSDRFENTTAAQVTFTVAQQPTK